MEKDLIIVESYGKINKIRSIVENKYKVVACGGHIIDIPSDKMGIDLETFDPEYSVIKNKQKIINGLKKEISKCRKIYIASDGDREGEMIAWSLINILGIKNYERIIFRSVTKDEILGAISKPAKINMDIVNSQKTRRILDKIIGYKISPLLWKNVGKGTSVGRVQSVMSKLIIEKENQIEKFKNGENKTSYSIVGNFKGGCGRLYKNDRIVTFENLEDCKNFILSVTYSFPNVQCLEFPISDVTKKIKTISQIYPLTTSSMQRESYNKLGFTVKKTMSLAKKLYQKGFITYIRTDSPKLSPEFLDSLEKHIGNNFGEEYCDSGNLSQNKKNKLSQDGHEAIRPTDIHIDADKLNIEDDCKKLYLLIKRTTISSKMLPPKYEIINANIKLDSEHYFKCKCSKIIFDGYLVQSSETSDASNISNISSGGENFMDIFSNTGNINKNKIKLLNISTKENIINPPKRYDEGKLIKKIGPDGLNIGRPSTYENMISKICKKKYVAKKNIPGITIPVYNYRWGNGNLEKIKKEVTIGKENNVFVPTCMGKKINEFMESEFPDIINYEFTSEMENILDSVANGDSDWKYELNKFYEPFEKKIQKIQNNNNLKIVGEYLGERENKQFFIVKTKNKKFVKVIQNGVPDKYMYIKNQKNNIDLEEAIRMDYYPKIIGNYKEHNVTLRYGPYGKYINWNKKNYKIKNNVESDKITLAFSIELINDN